MKYTFFWLDGSQQVLEGKAPEHALGRAGYSAGAIRALDFFAEGDNRGYIWYKHKWVKATSYVTVHALENDK